MQPHSYICEYPRNGYTEPTTTTVTVPPEAQCESFEWNKYNDHCYRYFTDGMSFTNAELFCQSKGGHLVSLNSVEEESNLQYALNWGFDWIWIGLRQDDEGGYYWTDDSPLDYNNYKTDQPVSKDILF